MATLDLAPSRPALKPAANDVALVLDSLQMRGLTGQQIGPFRVLEWLGEGGSAVVFRAERAAGLGSQVVALKLMHAGLHSASAKHRFFREQGILAQLTHPDIARLIEGGVSATGLPYMAMEFVDGAPLTRAADERQLDLVARLKLFVRVCRAVDAAHKALIVHCDLKPNNVLLDARGEVKVLDFGIAQLLGTHTDTDRLSWACTPAYAAPEQLQGEAPAVAIDVYALGLMLGELLTGRILRGLGEASASAVVRNQGLSNPPPGLPARERLARRLQGDLDAIIETAMAPLPSARYRSADALARDVERYLDGHVVHARPASTTDRLRKFVGRHTLAVSLVASLLLLIVCSLGFALLQMHSALREAQAAKESANRADTLRDFMFEVFSDAEPGAAHADRDDPRASDGARAATIIDAVERALVSVRANRDADPRARIELEIRLARVLSAQGAHQRASDVVEDAQRFVRLRLPVDDPLILEVEQLAASNLLALGDLAGARRRLDLLLRQLGPETPLIRLDALTTSALIAGRSRDLRRGRRDADAAVSLARELGEPRRLEQALRALGAVQRASGAWAEAIVTHEDLLARAQSRYGSAHERIAAEEAALAVAYRLAGDLDRAERHIRKALRIDALVYAGEHPQRAVHLNALAQVQMARRDFEQALKSSREATRIDRAAQGPLHLDTLIDLALTGVIQGQLQNWQESSRLTRKALDGHLHNGTEASWFGIRARIGYAHAQAQLGHRELAEAELERAILLAAQNPPMAAAQLQAQALERKARIALDADDQIAAARAIERMSGLTLAPEDYKLRARLAQLQTELLIARGAMAAALVPLQQADRAAARAAADPAVATDLLVLRALISSHTSPASAYPTVLAARQAFARLRFPPRHTVSYVDMLPLERGG